LRRLCLPMVSATMIPMIPPWKYCSISEMLLLLWAYEREKKLLRRAKK
jgi:hypothetical protein